MATHEHRRPNTVRGIAAALGRIVLVVAFTAVQAAALAVWLGTVRDAPVGSGSLVVGIAILLGGLVVEHALTDLAVNGRAATLPDAASVAVGAAEGALWALWLAVAGRVGGVEGVLFAGVALGATLVVHHTVEINDLRGRTPFAGVLNLGTIGISAVEAAGATAWLLVVTRREAVGRLLEAVGIGGVEPATVGVGLLAVALFVEHTAGVALARRA
ncbi:hypothetical protein [Halorussus marinus]|uniref:hypothetical protein n=1 Tax=Halorussus marinus TaxID=2505976 RepID=UPI0010920683|nr:hypothetical protein [Halorussus marinus]